MKPRQMPWNLRMRGKNWSVRFHHRGKPVERTTGTPKESEARKIAAVIYTDHVMGRTRTAPPTASEASTPVEKLGSLWLASISNKIVPQTLEGYAIHLSHIQEHFGVAANLTEPESEDYINWRLGKVQRETVMKEKTTLQALVNWAAKRKHIAEAFKVPEIGRNVLGTEYEVRRRGAATPMTAEEADAIVERLPEWSRTREGTPYPVRARFKFQRETGFRPSMLDRLSMPEHYRPGDETVRIERRTNKGRVTREMPLTKAALEALEAARDGRRKGLLFGKHTCRYILRAVAGTVLDADRTQRITQEDFRHKRLTEFVEVSSNPVGASFLAGHTNVNTIRHYAKPERAAADKVLAAMCPEEIEELDRQAELAKPGENLGKNLGTGEIVQSNPATGAVCPKEKPPENGGLSLVPRAGLEPAHHCWHWHLKPARLPIPPPGHWPGLDRGRAGI